jgi:EpsI family protein
MSGFNQRFAVATVFLLFAGVFLQARQRKEVFPAHIPMPCFPEQLGSFEGTDIPLDNETLQILGPGDFLLRVYSDHNDTDVNLFIAYFPSQRAGDTIHSPQNCLPGAGWVPVEKKHVLLMMPGHRDFPANRYVIQKGDSRQLVLYWYWAHDRGVASEYWAKYYLIADSLRMNRSDGALVRIMTTIYPGETADTAERRLGPFTDAVLPLLNDYIPR